MTSRAELCVRHVAGGFKVTLTGPYFAEAFSWEAPAEAVLELVQRWHSLLKLDAHRWVASDFETYGRELGCVLLSSDARQALNSCVLQGIEQGDDFSFRLRLQDPLAKSLPWELLSLTCPGCELGPVALTPNTSMLRLAGEDAISGAPSQTLRILIAYANPGTHRFPFLAHIDEEVLQLSEFFGRERSRVEFERLPNAGPATLSRVLRRFRPNHLHVISHAMRGTGGAELALQGGRQEEMVGSAELAEWLLEAGVQSVYLSACDTAGGTQGLAEALVAAGVPAAIGMQSPVRDEVQHAFVAEFYRELIRGKTLSEALAYARRARRHDAGWWIPVLATSSPGLRLLPAPTVEASTALPKNNLPMHDRTCVGRVADVNLLSRVLQGEGLRYSAITGIGGIGKSRLATEVMTRLAPEFPDGAWVVDCSLAESIEHVAASVAAHFGARIGEANIAEDLGEQLKGSQALLLFDSAENLVGLGLRELVERFAEKCPGIACLVTSRVAVGWKGDRHIPLGPLLVPDLDYSTGEAIEMFKEVARSSDRSLTIPESSMEIVADICRMVDGVPLAIQLAASRLRHLSLGELRDFVRASVTEALEDSDEAVENRLSMVIDASIASLRPPEIELLERLTLFVGGFYLVDAASALGLDEPQMFKALVRLTSHSVIEVARIGATPRYRLLDIVRERAIFKMQAGRDGSFQDADRVRYSARFAALCSDLGSEANEVEEFTGWLWLDIANIRAAYRFAIESGMSPQVGAFAQHLCLPFFEAGAWDDFQRLATAGHAVALETENSGLALRLLGLEGALAGRRGRTEECVQFWQRRLDRAREVGNLAVEADSLIDIATVAFQGGRYDEAESLVGSALGPAEQSSRHDLVATVHIIRALVCIERGQMEKAIEWAKIAEKASHGASGSPLMFVYTNLGRVFLAGGAPADAEKSYAGALRLAWAGRRQFHILGALLGLAKTRRALRDIENTARCLLAAKKLCAQIPSKRTGEIEALLQVVRGELLGSASGVVFAELAAQPWEKIVADVLERLEDWGKTMEFSDP